MYQPRGVDFGVECLEGLILLGRKIVICGYYLKAFALRREDAKREGGQWEEILWPAC
jgi:hypothetical protein